jgi:hypothetical protein
MVAFIRSSILVAGLVSFLTGQPAGAQQCPAVLRATGEDLAQRYAPVLFFAPGETYYPTIPVFPAWRGNGLQHLETTVPLDGERVSWDSLHVRYLREVHASERTMSKEESKIHPPAPALFYQSACLSSGEKRQLLGFLKNDPQAWHRLGVDTLFANGLEDAEFASITYYHYYIRDGGLEGHGHDSERIVVFRPMSVDPARTRHRREGEMNKQAQVQVRLESDSIQTLPARLVILVGTGHSPTTPNNVLVIRADDAQALQHPSVLIELGGHSSAADFNRDAAFSPGLDVNWNLAGAIWGTRDVQSIAGLAYLGGYKSWMTIPRTRGTFLTLTPSEAEETGVKHVPQIMDTVYNRGILPDRVERSYTLLPIEPFRELDSLTAAYRKHGCAPSDTTLDAVIALVNGTMMSLLRQGTGFQGFGDLSRERVSAIACLMGRWTDPMAARTVSKLTARAPWDHAEYGASRIATLKKQLYRPTVPGLQGATGLFSLLALSTNTRLGGGTHQAQLGLVVPVFALNDLLALPGIIEAYVGPARTSFFRKNAGPTRWGSVSLIYDREYKSTVSWYFGFDRVRRRRLVTGDARAGDVALVGGASVMPFFFKPDLIPPLATRLRFRFGVQLWQRGGNLSLGGFELRTALYLK